MKCKDCKFFSAYTKYSAVRTLTGELVFVELDEPSNGECRINPPRFDEIKWPIVQKEDFCGQFKTKEKDEK